MKNKAGIENMCQPMSCESSGIGSWELAVWASTFRCGQVGNGFDSQNLWGLSMVADENEPEPLGVYFMKYI